MHQRNKFYNKFVRATGCYFVTILNIWSVRAGIVINPLIVNKVYKNAVRKGYISKDCFMRYKSSSRISEILNAIYKKNVVVEYVGRFKEGSFSWDDNTKTLFTNLVGRHQKENNENSHFKEVSHDGECVHDTWPELGYNKSHLKGSRLFNVTEK